MADEVVLPIPNLTLPQDFFTLSTPSLSHLHENARTHLVQAIKEDRT
jgi:26S proteasome regulatory subunit N7